jgi:hypothetical protein
MSKESNPGGDRHMRSHCGGRGDAVRSGAVRSGAVRSDTLRYVFSGRFARPFGQKFQAGYLEAAEALLVATHSAGTGGYGGVA